MDSLPKGIGDLVPTRDTNADNQSDMDSLPKGIGDLVTGKIYFSPSRFPSDMDSLPKGIGDLPATWHDFWRVPLRPTWTHCRKALVTVALAGRLAVPVGPTWTHCRKALVTTSRRGPCGP